MEQRSGIFIVSLDFELYWGVRDTRTLDSYRRQLDGELWCIPRILELLCANQVHATWATVGFLLYPGYRALLDELPERIPAYRNARLSPYGYLNRRAIPRDLERYHFAPDLVRSIASFPGQEIATQTFSHFLCLEEGPNEEDFRADLAAAVRVAGNFGIGFKSIVFPRNQILSQYLPACADFGLEAYRGTERHWMYLPRKSREESLRNRSMRYLDSYFNVSGNNCYSIQQVAGSIPLNLPSSRFLRPYSRKLAFLEPLKLRRVLRAMEHAARNGLIYHIWWHPHNFGLHPQEGLATLNTIVQQFVRLRDDFGMASLNMRDLASLILRAEARRGGSSLEKGPALGRRHTGTRQS